MNDYLIPANSKKSLLIFGLFTKEDLIIFCIGLGMTLLMMLILDVSVLSNVIITLLPLALVSLLVMPVPNYHNIRVIITEIWNFYTTRQNFVWKGWCFLDGKDSKE